MQTLPLLTAAETAVFLDVRAGTQDAKMKLLASMATTSLEMATRRFFTRQTFTEYFTTRDNMTTDYDFRGSSDYALPSAIDFGGMRTLVKPQAVSLSGVNADPASAQVWYAPNGRGEDDFNDQTLVDPKEYAVDIGDDGALSRLHLYIGTRFRVRALKVVYDAGYTSAPTEGDDEEVTLSASIPLWLKQAALIQAQFLNIKLRKDNIGMGSERTVMEKGKVAVSSFLVTNGVTPEAMSFIAHLRQVSTGRG